MEEMPYEADFHCLVPRLETEIEYLYFYNRYFDNDIVYIARDRGQFQDK